MEPLSAILYTKTFWITSLFLTIYLYLKYVVYNVWANRGVPHDPPSIPLGNIPVKYFQGKTTHGAIVKESYDRYKTNPFYGMYMLYMPILVVKDPELIQLILVKHFNSFYNRGTLYNESKDPLSTGLVRLYDEKWKRLRVKLSPTFTSGKLKLMYPLVKEICDELLRVYEDVLDKSDVVEIKDITNRFTIDCISSIAFGFNCDSLHQPDNEFLKYGKISNDLGRVFLIFSFFVPRLVSLFPIPEKRKKVSEFFYDLFEKMVSHRRKDKTVRNDFLNMLMQLMDHGKVEEDDDAPSKSNSLTKITDADKITMVEAVGQSMFFFAAGQETTASAITYCLYELSFNQDIQEELYNEISQVAHSPEGLTYEKLFSMPYLDMVFRETLRKHPGAPMLNRQASEDFVVPGSHFVIKKGTRIVIPIKALHADPDIYPDPDKFDPTRFTSENKAKRHAFTYIPFGEGPRHCIGKRLGILKPKIALFYLLLNYKFSVCDKTPIPLRYMTDYFVQVPAGQVYLKVEKRNGTLSDKASRPWNSAN
ncbi:cytochrome P450 6a2 [Nasonia vitripennis]|uniref:Cytochrome P450 n=1 Tax=Nasonia vitripennis TaxID=7425 RepID=A0A7M7GC19_NASVI|nr:cytochrome P450 6a2 [Nasonia vitripennis]